MHGDGGLSATHEMYLKVLYRLQLASEVGRVRDLAKGLGCTASTVSAVLKKLEQAGLTNHDHYGTVKLSPAGMRIAECVVRRFEIIRTLLSEVLGVDDETAEVDACAMEHAVSPATVNRMERMVGLVKAGQIDLRAFVKGTNRSEAGRCCECETEGVCQAEIQITSELHPGRAASSKGLENSIR
ncbi:MAG: metal-dependent transcriptional regulator [Planctomycetes bacterium]|nr:metal-dependent transcriptional regulator [Planctomycetota bacterium]